MSELPVVVIGAGPQGLAAAAHLVEREETWSSSSAAVVPRPPYPSGVTCASSRHGRSSRTRPRVAFSSRPVGPHPRRGIPRGRSGVSGYLAPLAEVLASGSGTRRQSQESHVRDATRSSREGAGASRSSCIRSTPMVGNPDSSLAPSSTRAGTWGLPNPAGADGFPALGEAAAARAISYRIPADVSELAGSHVVVVGAGHSATHAVLRLSELARRAPGTRVTWMLRRGSAANVFGGGAGDELPERAALGSRARKVIDDGVVDLVTGFASPSSGRRPKG